jgi:hypothetical protein
VKVENNETKETNKHDLLDETTNRILKEKYFSALYVNFPVLMVYPSEGEMIFEVIRRVQ